MLGSRRVPAPTDLEILDRIYECYYREFEQYTDQEDGRAAKIYVPIDLEKVADELGVDADIVFGRLYYDLEKRYGYAQDDGSKVHFFALKIGGDAHAVNFPYLASVVAQLRAKKEKHLTATVISIVSLLIAIASIGISLISSSGGS